ncbi:MAG: phosphotransferase [Defluviitaleaceae bacterium]|nr:phosphotransferase [Defluviitaleaceae bacterium]
MRTIQIFDAANYESHWTKFKRDSARAIVFIGNKLLMVQSQKYGEYKFPGGGIKKGETHNQALIREVKEETGYSLIEDSIADYGKTLILRKGSGQNEIFEQESFYFTCKVDEHDTSTPTPDDGYEKEYDYNPIIVTLEEAINKNEQLLNIPDIPWVSRDLAVLKELAPSIKAAREYWNLQCETFEHIQTSAHNSSWSIDGKFVLRRILEPNIAQLTQTIQLSNLLDGAGIPTVVYLKTTSGGWSTPSGEYCLMEKLNGEHCDFYESPILAKELGRGLARLHLALSEIESELQYKDYDFLSEWNNYIKTGLVGVSDEIICRVETIIFNNYKNLPRTPIHRDAHSRNVLFNDEKLSGWLDFDLSRKDARIFDLAYFLAGLLVGEINNPDKLRIWKQICRNSIEGYSEISPLNGEEIKSLPCFMIAIELLFVTYWNSVGNDKEHEKAKELAVWIHEVGFEEFLA